MPWGGEWGSPLATAARGRMGTATVRGSEPPQHGDTSLLSHMPRTAPPRRGRTDHMHMDAGEGRGGGRRLMVTRRDMTVGRRWHVGGGSQRHARRTGLYLRRRLHCKRAACTMQTETGVRNNGTRQRGHAARGHPPAETRHLQAPPRHAHAKPGLPPGTAAVRYCDTAWGPFPGEPQPHRGRWWGAAQVCSRAWGATVGSSPVQVSRGQGNGGWCG